jgi:hypothetical protein
MQPTPFKRASAMVQALSAILSSSLSPLEMQQQVADLGSYSSRGKSGKRAYTTGHKHMANVRRARKAHNIAKRK